MERLFDIQLEKLKTRLIKMCSLVDEQVELAIRSVNEINHELAALVEERDEKVDRFDSKIEKVCQKIIALNQPVAVDLRLLISALKINSNLERIGDLVINISRHARDLSARPSFVEKLDFEEISITTREMIKGAFDSFINSDTELAKKVLTNDDKLDSLVRENSKRLLEIMKGDSALIDQAMTFHSILQELERIGDHATNISEEVYFIQKAKSIKHRHLEEDDFRDEIL